MTTTPSLAEVIALSELATAGPWLAMRGSESTGREVADWAITVDDASTWVCTGPTWDSEYQEESYSNGQFIAALVNWFRTSAASLRDEDAWIRVSDELPDKPGWYIGLNYGAQEPLRFDGSNWHHTRVTRDLAMPSHWMRFTDIARPAPTQPAAQERQA